MAPLKRHCDKCREIEYITELVVRKGYFYCKRCIVEIDKSYSQTKSDLFKQEALKIATQNGLKNTEYIISDIEKINNPLLNNKIFSNEKITEEEKSILCQELERDLCKEMIVQALGYNYKEEKLTLIKAPDTKKETGGWVEVKKEITTKRIPGNSQLFIMFMTNKFPDLWKVSKELVHSKTENYDAEPSKRDRKKIMSLARDILEANPDEPKG
jgi:hypothetical protein